MCNYADTIVKIVAGTHEDGLLLHLPNVNDFLRDIYDETGIMLIPKQQFDYYESTHLDRHGEPFINKRINKRKNLIIMPTLSLDKLIVVRVGDVQQVTESFRKRELICDADTSGQYPQRIKFEAIQAKCDDQNLLECRTGDEITVHFNLNGKESTGKDGYPIVFNALNIWKIDINRTTAGNATQPNQANFVPQPQAATPQQSAASFMDDEDGDLPF